MDVQYNQVKVVFEPNIEKRLAGIGKVVGFGQAEFSGDFTTASQSFLPPFSFNEEEELNEGVKHVNHQIAEGDLNLSEIAFSEPNSPINKSLMPPTIEELKEQAPSKSEQKHKE
jgi:hypothetical protein